MMFDTFTTEEHLEYQEWLRAVDEETPEMTPDECTGCDGSGIRQAPYFYEVGYIWEDEKCPVCNGDDYIPC